MKRSASFILLLLFVPIHVLADVPLSVDYNAVYYNATKSCRLAGGPAGSGPLYGPRFPQISDTVDLAKRITSFINDMVPGSSLAGSADQLVSEGQKYNVNPAMAVGQGLKETSLGTAGVGRPPVNDIFAVRNGANGAFDGYSSPGAAVTAYYEILSSGTYLGPPANKETTLDVFSTYAPYGDGYNDPVAYNAFVQDVMHKILDGIATSGSTTTSTTPTPTPAPVASTGCAGSANSQGWDLSGQNTMVFYSQLDPSWADHPYGAGKSPIATAGCGPTALAMVIATLNHDSSVNPVTIADRYGADYHQWNPEGGTEWSLFPVVAQDYGLKMQDLGTDTAAAAQVIKQGGLVVGSFDTGAFTQSGHIMVLRAVTADGGSFYLANPAAKTISDSTNTTPYTTDYLLTTGSMRHLWGYTK